MTNLNPKIWGPHAWFFIDSVVIGLPDNISNELQIQLKYFFVSMSFLLPCESCRLHFTNYLKTTNIDFSTKTKVLKWVNNIHNNVRKNNKTKNISLEKTIQYYNSIYNQKTEFYDVFFLSLFVVGLLFIIKFILFPITN